MRLRLACALAADERVHAFAVHVEVQAYKHLIHMEAAGKVATRVAGEERDGHRFREQIFAADGVVGLIRTAEDPRTVKKIGEEDLTMLVKERPAKLHTIKVKGAAGGTFWILDNAALPMIVKGETKWKWMATAIGDSGSAGSQVVSALKQTGEATTHAILFAFNSAELDREAKPVLDSVTQYLKNNPKVRLDIQGHTDNIGGAPFNLVLSQKRADAVKAYFAAASIGAGRLTAKGYGLSMPVAGNATPEGRAQNRRVVFRAL